MKDDCFVGSFLYFFKGEKMRGNVFGLIVAILFFNNACSSTGTNCSDGEKAVDGECYTVCSTTHDCLTRHGGGWLCMAEGYCRMATGENSTPNTNGGEYQVDVVSEKDNNSKPEPEQCIPTDEICDGFDNDCDNEVDEICDCQPNQMKACGSELGVCEAGVQTCGEDYKWGECENAVMPSSEKCNGLDDDCDGESDEDFDLSDDPMNCGACGNKCAVSNAINSCVNYECVFECLPNFYDFDNVVGCETPCVLTNAGVEQCDGIDNDCDGSVDEDFNFNSLAHCGGCGKVCNFANASAQCLAGNCLFVECNVGFVDLNNDKTDGCEFGCVYSGDEICDGLDNDCDGSVDELIYCECPENDEMDCGPDVGVCHDGHQYCHDGKWSVCDGTFGSAEICNYLDDDCDGQSDEDFNLFTDEENCGYCGLICNFFNAAAVCVSGKCQMSDCNFGWVDADNDADNGCEYACLPTNGGIEQCDGIDNDCDGVADEGFDLLTDANNCGQCGNSCYVVNAAEISCEDGACLLLECFENYYDWNKFTGDGCEYSCEISNEGNEICDGIDNDCDGTADNNGAGCDCELGDSQACGSSIGECEKGTQICLTNGDYSACDDIKPAVEICDGKDNDCDGATDETFNLMTDVNNCGSCGNICNYSNAINGCVNGECVIVSCKLGWWNLEGKGCEYGCFLTNNGIEKCDDIDNDCDGVADEDFDLQTDYNNCGQCGHTCLLPRVQESFCFTGKCQIVTCEQNYYEFNGYLPDGCEYPCSISNNGVEVGDNKDNDCDGQIDEGVDCFEGYSVDCGSNVGVCVFGKQTCENGKMTECLGGVSPSPEKCDYLDNDCDGAVDEDFNLLISLENCGECGFVCNLPNAISSCQSGECRVVSCDFGWWNFDLNHENGCESGCFKTFGGLEKCDEIDNDCDNQIDEDFDLQNDKFNCGECGNVCKFDNAIADCKFGLCLLMGCANNYYDIDNNWLTGCEYYCENTGVEACDNQDNNCDGVIDEGCECADGDVRVCGHFIIGICNFGFEVCFEGDWGDCQNAQLPIAESCNGLDDDCDGVADEDFDVMSDINNCGSCGMECPLFKNATTSCKYGTCFVSACHPGFLDLNLDVIDGCEYQCFPTMGGLEKCDGIDNDCDGLIDETYDFDSDSMNCGGCAIRCEFPGAIGFCSSGVCQTNSCLPNYYNMNGDWSDGCEYHCVISNGGVEVGDNKDNDCDGSTDEDVACFENSTNVCGSKIGECEPGTHVCSGGKWSVCMGEKVGTVEVCDGLDNDCDNSVDEDYNLLTDENNCGSCGNVCNFANAESICLNGVCQILQCLPSFWSFSDTPTLGCWYQCVPTNNGVEVCDGVDNDCDRVIDGGPTIDKMTDVHNCGACGNDCTELAQVNTASCINGVCFINSCIYGYNNFDNDYLTGCEAFCVPSGLEVFDGKDNDCDGMTDEGTSPSDMISCSMCCPAGSQPIIWYGEAPVIWTTYGLNCGTVTMAQAEICKRGDHPDYYNAGWIDFNCYDPSAGWGGWATNAVATCTNDTDGTSVSWQVITGTVDPRGEAEIILSGVCPQP